MTTVPKQFEDLTLRDLLRLYTGPHALECPPELVEALECAIKVDELIELRRSNDELERPLALRDARKALAK